MKKARNYFTICNEIEDNDLSHRLGYVAAKAVVANARNSMDLYLSGYPKQFARREENRLFQSLESLLGDDPQCSGLLDDFSHARNKIDSRIININFVYDALVFCYEQERTFYGKKDSLKKASDFLGEHLLTLKKKGSKGIRWRQQQNHSSVRTKEYEAYVTRLKNSLVSRYNAIFQ